MFDRLNFLRDGCFQLVRGAALATMSAGILFGAAAGAQTDGQPLVSASLSDATPELGNPGQLLAGDTLRYQLSILDFSLNDDFSGFEFSFDLGDAYAGITVGSANPNGYTNSCGGSIDLAQGNETVTHTGGAISSGFATSCSISFNVSVPSTIPEGVYTLSGGRLIGFATGTTNAAFDIAIPDASFTVVADTTGPSTVVAVPGSFLPNAPFTMGIVFNEPVDGFTISDISVTGATLSDFVVGNPDAESIGDYERSYSVTVTPTGAGTVSLSVGAGAAQDEADNDSSAASVDVEIIEPADLSVEFVDSPVDAADITTLRYTITNTSGTNAMSGVRVDLNLANIISTMAASGALPGTPCGGSSSITGTTNLILTGGDIAAGGSCTFDVNVQVPAAAEAGSYAGPTANFQYTIDGVAVTADSISVALAIAGAEGSGAPLLFSAGFLTSPILDDGTSTIEFSIAPAEGTDATDLAFTLDLDSVISGMVAVDLPLADACGTGSSVSGTSIITLAGGNLLEGETCTFQVDVTLPGGVAGGGYVFQTSNLTGNADDGDAITAINADPASDTLTVLSIVPSVTITGPSADVGGDFIIEIRFGEPITGFDVSELSVTNGVASALSADAGLDFTATITPAGPGAVTVELPADSVLDADLNGNTVSNLFSVTAVTPEPEIAVTGLGVSIVDGDSTPNTIDGTLLGSTDTLAGSITRTFVIENSGTGALTLSGGPDFVAISGADAADFSVATQPASPIAAGGSSSFQILYDPSAVATDSVTLTILSDDADEATFTFDISGTGVAAPEINLTGNAVSIPDGDGSPSATDDTLFGEVNLGESLARTFTIENTGSAVLTLGTNAVQLDQPGDDFTVTSQPATTVAAGLSTTFEITFAPTVYPEQQVSVLISNDDSNENPYNFGISGEGAGGPDVNLTGLGLTIADEDASPSANDGTDFGSTNVGVAAFRTFVIENNGTTDLVLSVAPADRAGDTVGSTLVDVFGDSDFSMVSQPTSPIVAGSSASFIVQYLPTSTGATAATTLAFGTDDFDTPRYDFAITGFATTPEIDVLGEGLSIADADATPRGDDGTLFASLNEDSGTDSQTFTIENNGDGPLTLGADAVSISGAASGDFSVTTQPATSVAASGSTTFTIEFDPTTTGTRSATINIANDDLDEAPYSFGVEGEGLDITAPTGFAVAFDDSLINAAEAGSISFSFTGAEVGSTYAYAISSAGGGTDVTASGVIATATDTISGIDVSALGDGELTLSATLTDIFSNESDPETDTTDLDQAAPDLAIAGPSATQVGAFTATFTFTEDVTGFTVGDIDVGNGAASGFTATSASVYTATITPAADGTVTVDVAAAVAVDAAGNDTTVATQFSVEA
ncbi:choice-of-anchor D domain-containing protein, partial [Maricaulis sp.]|uniref:beta strand repeat-containing protein n=1 Tax=Maricaulis sp. TaxID=1486257 RepID=UPI0025BBDD03